MALINIKDWKQHSFLYSNCFSPNNYSDIKSKSMTKILADDTKLGGLINTGKSWSIIQEELDLFEDWGIEMRKFNSSENRVIYCGSNKWEFLQYAKELIVWNNWGERKKRQMYTSTQRDYEPPTWFSQEKGKCNPRLYQQSYFQYRHGVIGAIVETPGGNLSTILYLILTIHEQERWTQTGKEPQKGCYDYKRRGEPILQGGIFKKKKKKKIRSGEHTWEEKELLKLKDNISQGSNRY